MILNFDLKNNEAVPMTRRYPNLAAKVLKRDSEIAKKLISLDDKDHKGQEILDIFLKECKNLSDERYWELLRTVWVISGTVANADLFRRLMRSPRKERYYFSTPEEAKKLREMPEPFMVYRATNDEHDGGLSWTISKEYAEYYKEAYHKAKVISRSVTRKEVFAFIERNLEAEIVIL